MRKMIAVATAAAMMVSFANEASYALASNKQQAVNVQSALTNPLKAAVLPFGLNGNPLLNAYNAVFKMNTANIKSISNNGGRYFDSRIEKAIDGNMNTHWETGKPNKTAFTNEVIVHLNEATTLNRIVYAARQESAKGKGFAEQFEIYSSTADSGDQFTLVSSGEYKGSTGDIVEMKFAPTAFKRIKFVFKKATQDWASAAEFSFYKEDAVSDAVNKLFTDGTMSKVVPAYNDAAKINVLDVSAQAHPLYPIFKEQLQLAQKLVSGDFQIEGTIVTAEQHGDMKKHAQQNLRFGYGTNRQPTGFTAMAGQQINVYLDVDATAQQRLPSLFFTQQEGSFSSWVTSVPLKPGKNTITVPAIVADEEYAHEVTKGGTMYIVNPYTPEEQGKAPRIRFEGAQQVPFMTKTTNVEQFKTFLTAYKLKIDEDKAANPNVKDRKFIDVVEMASDRIVFTGTATEAYNQFITLNRNPLDTLLGYDFWIDQNFDFYGLDSSSSNHDPKQIRENIRLMQPYGYMYAAGDHVGIQIEEVSLMLADFRKSYPGWGLTHEIGHRMAVGEREYAEVSNNMLSMALSIHYGQMDTRMPFESEIYKYVIAENKVVSDQQSYWARLAAYWQLELAHPGYWSELNRLYRERKVKLENGDNSKQQYLVEFSSEVLGFDLSRFFAGHGFTVNPETKVKVAKYPASPKLWYLNNSLVNYEGTGISDKNATVKVEVSANKAAATNTLSFSMDQAYKKDLLGYEIYRNDQLVGFTGTDQFVDQNIDTNMNYTYKIVGYDKKLNTIKPAEVKAFKPALAVEEHITLKLHQAFDPLQFVKAVDYQGNEITNEIVVQSNNVDVTRKGKYEIVYAVTSGEVVETKTANVTVTSNYVYASDLVAKSVIVGWGSFKKDSSPEGSAITLLRQGMAAIYVKGLGVHVDSEIVYDIEGKGYDFFESYIGIDQAMKGKRSSATFEVYVDGVLKLSSDVFRASTEHQFVKIPVTGAKEIKLVTTDANENGGVSDHTVWADAKFSMSSTAPTLAIPQSISTKVGQPITLQGIYSATDAEDGDLTAQVNVTGEDGVDFNRAGQYPIIYTVTDHEGNTVTKTRMVTVANMDDFKYVSDYDWKSTDNSYTAPRKDISISNKALRLTNEENKEVVYKRGLGAHSTSAIVYDLSGQNAAYFTSFVGVDRQMYNSVGSISFEVYVDGEKKFDSGLMRAKDTQKFIELDINGAKELKLVVTDGDNGDGSDHATWGDAKFHFARGMSLRE